MKSDKLIKHSFAYAKPRPAKSGNIPFNIYSFIGCVNTYYDLPPDVVNRIKYVLNQIGNEYSLYFGTIRYENVVSGITVWAMQEWKSRFMSESPPFDITDYVTQLYGVSRVKENMTQIYYVQLIVQYVFGNITYTANKASLPVLNKTVLSS